MPKKDYAYYYAQLRRIEEHREATAEKAIRKMYKGMLKELQRFVAEEYVALADDGKLTYEILRSKGQEARFLQEVEDKLSGLSLDVQKEIRKTVEDVYQLAYDGLRDAVNKAKDTEELRQILQGMDMQTAQTMWATVDNTIMDIALEKNHKENTWNIKRAVATALREGDRFETMARRMEQELGYTHRKAILITRTEVHRVREAGHIASAQELNKTLQKGKSGLRFVKKWKTMGDERVRPNHWYKTKKGWKKSKSKSAANHERMHNVVVEADELFDLGTYQGRKIETQGPGQSGVAAHDCNCRCQCLTLLMDDAEFFKATGRHFKDYEPEPKQMTMQEPDNSFAPDGYDKERFEATLQSFRAEYMGLDYENAVTVNRAGTVTKRAKAKDRKNVVEIVPKKNEVVMHTHPSGGTFSLQDISNTALNSGDGIIACTMGGDFYFIKGKEFDGVKLASRLQSTKTNTEFRFSDSAWREKWLEDNASKYGYIFKFIQR